MGQVAQTEPLPRIESLAEAEFWLNVLHRCSCTDAGNIAHLYDRIAWLALPWWRRAFRRPPWLR